MLEFTLKKIGEWLFYNAHGCWHNGYENSCKLCTNRLNPFYSNKGTKEKKKKKKPLPLFRTLWHQGIRGTLQSGMGRSGARWSGACIHQFRSYKTSNHLNAKISREKKEQCWVKRLNRHADSGQAQAEAPPSPERGHSSSGCFSTPHAENLWIYINIKHPG